MEDADKDTSTGANEALTVEDAARTLEGLLSDNSEDTQPTGGSQHAEGDEGREPADPEGTSEEGQPAEEAGEGAEEAEEQPTYTIKVDGEDVTVTLDELLKGYSRTADYTRKTQKLAEERKAFQPEVEAVRSERQKYAAALKQVEETLQQMQPKEPDWDALAESDPDTYLRARAQWQQFRDAQEVIKRERLETEARMQADFQRQMQEYLATERQRLVEAIPEWKDPEKAKAEKARLVEFALSRGFTQEELAQTVDHRAIVILRDAMLYHDLKKAAPAKQNHLVKPVKTAPPGTPKKRPTALTDAKKRLAESGSVHDAAAVFMQILD